MGILSTKKIEITHSDGSCGGDKELELDINMWNSLRSSVKEQFLAQKQEFSSSTNLITDGLLDGSGV